MLICGLQSDLIPRAVTIIAKTLHKMVAQKGRAIIGVVGGRSVAAIFQSLGSQDLPWPKIHFLLLDERLVPPDHPDSNFRLAHEALGEAASARLYPFCTTTAQPGENVTAYNSVIAELGGVIDIVLVSAGEDGHIASLFPEHSELKHAKPEFILVKDAPKPPPDRMSATLSLIGGAAVGVLLFFGESKRQALRNYLSPSTTVDQCPAKIIATIKENYLFTDLKRNNT